jgi:methyl-accepting chemotaxis protein
MIPKIRNYFATFAVAGLGLLSVGAGTQPQYRAVTPVANENLSPQDREMVALANDFAARCADTLEKWIAKQELSQEKLFSFLYYPIPKTDPPKFNTDWDRLSDRDILPIEEAVLSRSAAISFAVLVDRNGYLPTHNQRYAQPLTGNPAIDLVNNRTKRIFNDRTGFAAASNEAPYLVQKYQRDTGETMVDLSVPVFVRGQRWGAVRIGYRLVDAR